MADKLQRNYRLTIEANDDAGAIIIEPPFTISFVVNRSVMASINSSQIRIYNLSEKIRNQIFQDRFNTTKRKKVVLQAGYSKLSTIFVGDMFEADSFRQGTEVITVIEARDGGFDSSGTLTNNTIQKNTEIKTLLQGLISEFPNLKTGVIGEVEGSIKRPAVLDSNTFELIRKYSNDKAFIDLETVNILNDDEVIAGDLPLINSETGLLGTPRRRDSYLTIDVLFEPQIVMGQLIKIESDIQKQYDGQYKVVGLTHTGMISEAVSGECKTNLSLLIGTQLVGGFKQL